MSPDKWGLQENITWRKICSVWFVQEDSTDR